MLNILAAGSLRRVWAPLIARFEAETGILIETQFGPAGMLRERIEQGEPCDLFASANITHPLTLQRMGIAQEVHPFAGNRLCLTVAKSVAAENADWLEMLSREDLRLATSTPGCDPSGDYTWQLFDNIEQRNPGLGESIRKRAQPLVGGRATVQVPEGELAGAWLIRNHYADMFIGYRSYAPALREQPEVAVYDIALEYNIRSVYAFAVCHPAAKGLADFLLSAPTQQFLVDFGFET